MRPASFIFNKLLSFFKRKLSIDDLEKQISYLRAQVSTLVGDKITYKRETDQRLKYLEDLSKKSS